MWWLIGIGKRPTCRGGKTYTTCNMSDCSYHGWLEQGFRSKNRFVNWLIEKRIDY